MTSIGIIGSGFGGVAVAVEMLRGGHDDLQIWERGDDLGGVWRDNTYPGAGCDVPSPLYSFSYAPNPNWSRRYALQQEIHDYLRRVADQHGVTPRITYGREVTAATWVDDDHRWTVTFADGSSQSVDLLISAVGQLSEPRVPALPGADSFEGPSFHSARWDHGADMQGRTVAVVGSGASAVQLVPHLVRDGERVVLFQRSPNYLLPKPDMPYRSWHAGLFHRVPATQQLERAGIWTLMEQFARGLDASSPVGKINHTLAMRHLHSQVKDPELRAKLTPDYPIGCKRILFSNDFYPALAEPTVEVVTEAVTEVRPHGVVDATGREHPADVVVYATGFDAQDFLDTIDVTGADGEKLATRWADGARAYLGMYVPGFPEPVRHLWTEHEPRRRIDHLHAGGAGPAHAPGRRPARGRSVRQRRGDRRDRPGLRPGTARAAGTLGLGQLRELVPPPVRPHHVELARSDPAVRPTHSHAGAGRVRLGLRSIAVRPPACGRSR